MAGYFGVGGFQGGCWASNFEGTLKQVDLGILF